eukprot:gene2156-2474_t
MSSAVLQHPGARRPQAPGGGKAASEELVYSVRADSFSNGIEAREEAGDDPAEMVRVWLALGSIAWSRSSITFSGHSSQVYRWDFNVFDFSKKAKDQHVLLELVQILLEDYGLLNGWKLEPDKVVAYFLKVEEIYRANPYHNKTHAADVTQTAAVIMQALDQDLSLSKLEAFSIIFASAVHDLGHPGVNNAFLIKTRNEQAIIHNDRSVNENMHACLAFQLAFSSPELNIFENFSTTEFEQMRKLVLDMVLSTDMDVHFALLKRFDDAVSAVPDLTTWTSIEQRSLMFQILVHLADLANPSRPWHLALTWAEWVVTEFLGQGAREAEAGIPVSDFCNKDKVCMPNAQLFFIERFMQPTLETFRPAAPAFYQLALPWLNDTKSKWQAFKAAGVRLPHEEYPTLPAPAAPLPPTAFEGHSS